MRSVIAAVVDNKFGVLARVSGLFMRRGFNIDTLTVGTTEDSDYSRITVTLEGDEFVREQLIRQMMKLYNVRWVRLLDGGDKVERELILVKLQNRPDAREKLCGANGCSVRILGETEQTLCAEATGDPAAVQAFLESLKPLGILEVCRTGVVALD